MNHVFISGIPASGKSYLAAKVAKETGVIHVCLDDLREEMRTNPELKRWTDFFWDLDEEKYWQEVSCNQQWENIKKQSEAFWPVILKKINEVKRSGSGAIFEGVNILPHLASQDLDFPGIVLLGESFEQILERNKQDPRWSNTEELQIKEAKAFWNCERPRYKAEAEKYGFKTFSKSMEAERELLQVLKSQLEIEVQN